MTLKEQMEQKNILNKKNLDQKLLEFKFVSEQDRKVVEEDRRKREEKFKYLSKIRDVNKAVNIEFISFFNLFQRINQKRIYTTKFIHKPVSHVIIIKFFICICHVYM